MMASATEELNAEKQFSPEAESSKIGPGVRAEASPDAKCPICLDRFDNMSYIDRCFHKFCFRCIQEWARNKAECPLCKQPFHSIFHSVRAENDFQEYVLKVAENSLGSAAAGSPRFRYRTTLTRERRAGAIQAGLLPESGVVFEGLGQGRGGGRSMRRLMVRRLGGGRRAQSEERAREQEMLSFRRELYRAGMRVRGVRDGGRSRDISAGFFRRNAACLHRLVPWLRRELRVLLGSHGSVLSIVQHIVLSNLVRHDLEGLAFQRELRPFLLGRTEHFLHEFASFARAPFNMDTYDQRAEYDCPAPPPPPPPVPPHGGESDSDLSVIAISPDSAQHRAGARSSPHPLESPLPLSQAAWDDETPGPSYSLAEALEPGDSSPDQTPEEALQPPPPLPQAASLLAAPIKTDPGTKEEALTRSAEDCLIIGYVKPLAERTPELIELSSDSELSLQLTSTEAVSQPVHIQFHGSSTSDWSSSTARSSSSASARSSLSRDHWERKKAKRKKSSRSKREKRHGHKKSSCSGGSTTSSGRHRARRPSRAHGDSRDRFRVPSESRDKRDLRRHERSSSRDRTMVTYSYNRGEHQAKDCSRRSRRDRSSSRERARSGSTQTRDRRRSRNRERASSTRSRTRSQNSDSVVCRHRARSRSWSRDYATVRDQRRSRSRERTYSYMREYQERNRGFSYQWERYSYHSRTNDGHDSVTGTRTHHRRRSPCSDYRIRSSSDSTSFRSPSSHREDVYYQYRSYQSRSPSSTRSRTTSGRTDKGRHEKPGGKRKYKTHYLESSSVKESKSASLQITNLSSEIHVMPRKEGSSPGPLSQCSNNSKSGSALFENALGSEPKSKKHKEKKRSSSVEIVYEGKATEASRRHKKKKKHKKKHKKEKSNERTEEACLSPLVITIESDSDDVIVTSMECNNSTVGTTTNPLESNSFELVEKCVLETEAARDLPHAAANIFFGHTSTESLDVCGLSTDSDRSPPNPNNHTRLGPEGVNPVTDAGYHRNFKGEEQDHGQRCPSPRTGLPKNSSDRPPLILKIPKRFINGANLFNRSTENA